MKKFIAAAILAGLAASAFAQDAPTLKFSGYFDSGFAAHTNGLDPAPFGLWGNDAGKNGGRFNLDGTYGTADVGFKFELRSESWNTNSSTFVKSVTTATTGNPVTKVTTTTTSGSDANTAQMPQLKFGYVYANLFDKLVTVNAGIVKDGTWNTAGDAAYKPVDSEAGVQLIVKPVAGLTVGTFLNVPYLGSSTTARVAGSNYAQDIGLDVAASYAMDKVVSVVAGIKSYPTTKQKYTTADKSAMSGLLEYYLGAGLTAVPNLTAILEAKGTKVNDYALSGKTEIVQTLKYNLKDAGLDAVTAGLVAYEWAYGKDIKDTDAKALGLSYKVNPWASYKLDSVTTLKLGASYLAGFEAAVTSAADSKFAVGGVAPVAFEAAYAKRKLGLYQIKPEASFALSPALTVTTFYALTASAGSNDVYFVNGANKKTSLNSVVVDFLYKF